MNIRTYIKRFMAAATFIVASMTLASCDNAIYDEEGDCEVRYHMDMKTI